MAEDNVLASNNNDEEESDICSNISSVNPASPVHKKRKKNSKRKNKHTNEPNMMEIIKQQHSMIKQLQERITSLESLINNAEDSPVEMEEEADEFPSLRTVDTNQKSKGHLSPSAENHDDQGREVKEAMNKCHGNKSPAATKEGSKVVGKKKPPPVVVYNVEPKNIISKIKNENCNFNVNVVNKNILKILPQQNGDHSKIVTFLKNDNYKFFTFTPNNNRPYSFVIKKLPISYEIVDVNDAISGLKISASIIKIIKTKFHFILQVANDSNVSEILNIKYLLHCKVAIEPLKRKRLTQCKNCQRYNHSAVNCNMPYRCVKCAGSHEPGNCPIPKKEDNNEVVTVTDELTGVQSNRIGVPVKCANCGKEGHTATHQFAK